ncbi:MAG: HlyD family efflux transporter periplasmic adaptor subunit, partial [Candidatus Eremiobacteraeota bacterium]|nr:HlyD family efflux transporter periplasmic adaptor subunit [Candidatus Eremiobacteraeota bacterium]
MNRTRNLVILAVAVALIVAVALFASHRGNGEALPVKLTRIEPATFTIKLPENGVVMRPLAATIPTLVAGNIGTMYVKAGDHVDAGQLLATIGNPALLFNAAGSQADYNSAAANVSAARVQEQNAQVGYQAAVDTNKSALDEARRVYDADVSLYNNKAIPRNQLDADRAKLEQAQVAYSQAVEQARLGAVSGYNGSSVASAEAAARKMQIVNAQNQQQLGFTRIVAPFSGTIQTVAAQPNDPLRPLQSGDAVTEGQAMFTLAGEGGYIVKAEVDEQDIINVRIGQRVNISGQDFPAKIVRGHVAQIAPVATKSTDPSSTAKQVLTTIALDSSPAFLKDGMTADVDIL